MYESGIGAGSERTSSADRTGEAHARAAALERADASGRDAGAAPAGEPVARSPSTAQSLAAQRSTGDALADAPSTAERLAGGEPARVGDGGVARGPGDGVVDTVNGIAPDGLALTGHGMTRAGYGTQVDNPRLSVQWESTRSATTGKGGFTDGARARFDGTGIEVVGTVNGVPAGSIGPSSGLPASAVNTHNGNLARDRIAARFTGADQSVRVEAKYDASLRAVPSEVRRSNLPGDRNVDVQVDIAHPSDPRLDERIEIESKAGRVDAGRVGDAQLGHDAARLSRNRALRAGGVALERVGRVARPVGMVLDAVELGSAFRADGDRVGANTGRAASSLAGGGLGGWGGATLGAAIGTAVLPGVGTVVGGVLGGAVGAIAGSELAKGAFDKIGGWFS